MKTSIRLACLAATLVCAAAATAAETALHLATNSAPDAWTVRFGSQPILTYAFPRGQFKPCVKELAPPGGANILRDAPSDHLHHHALMYAVAVNGLNF